MFECAHGDVGGSGAARRRRDRRLRMHWRHEQLSLRMLRASVGHHSWQSRTSVGVQTDVVPVIESFPSSGLVGPQFSLTVGETSHVAHAVPLFRMARGHSVEQSLPAPGCAPQLGDDMGLQRGDAEFIEMLVMSSCFALRLPEPGGASRLNHVTCSSCPAFGGAPCLAGEALRGGDSDVRGVRPRMADHGAGVHSHVQQRAAVQGENVRMEQVFVQAFPAVQDDPMFEPETPEVQVGVPRLARVQQRTVGSGENWRPFKCCSNLLLNGVCQRGYNCTFAHSSFELHPRAPPTQHMMMEAFERGW